MLKIMTLLLSLFCLNVAHADNSVGVDLGYKADNFLGIKWMQSLKQIPNMQEKGQGVFQKKDEELKIADIKLDHVDYRFSEGTLANDYIFSSGVIVVKGVENCSKFKKLVFEKFGENYKYESVSTNKEIWYWQGGMAIPDARLEFNKESNEMTYTTTTNWQSSSIYSPSADHDNGL